MIRAVVFDLWQTLAIWPEERSADARRLWAESLGVPSERIDEIWYGGELYRQRETGPIAPAIAALHDAVGSAASVDEIVARRVELTRTALVPVPGALSTLRALRKRGIATGLVSNCTEEVALVWRTTAFHGLFDATVFSATAGCMKPEPRTYERVLAALGVPADETLFVGDGANDELVGARRAGMTPVLLCDQTGTPFWEALGDWDGIRITDVTHVLGLAE